MMVHYALKIVLIRILFNYYFTFKFIQAIFHLNFVLEHIKNLKTFIEGGLALTCTRKR